MKSPKSKISKTARTGKEIDMYTIRYKDGFLQCYIDRDECMVMLPKGDGSWLIEESKSQRAGKSRITNAMKKLV